MAQDKVKIVMLTGYLGAGKTTLLNHVLANEQGIRAAVIVNDIGEVNLDADLIAGTGAVANLDDIIPLTNGCICCTLADDLAEQLTSIANSGKFDYIIIEASGICEPIPIAYTISSFCEDGLMGEDVDAAGVDVASAEDAAGVTDAGVEGTGVADAIGVTNAEAEGAEADAAGLADTADAMGMEDAGEMGASAAGVTGAGAEGAGQSADDAAAGGARLALDNIVAVVDCARMYEEFNGGAALLADDIEEDDVENLLIQQIEFCTTLVMNKADLVTPEQMAELKAIVRSLQKDARIIEAVQGEVALDEVLNTGRFSFADAYGSAAWAEAMEHPEEHEDPEVLEYDISTFVYRRRAPFDMERLSALVTDWPESVVRCKGILWRADAPDDCFVFEQAGKHFYLTENGQFVAAYSADEQKAAFQEAPQLLDEWDDELGDRQNKLVFIGRHMDKAEVEARLDACLAQ